MNLTAVRSFSKLIEYFLILYGIPEYIRYRHQTAKFHAGID